VAYALSQIQTLWLGDSKVNLSPTQLVDGFNAAEQHLGTEWVERHRIDGNVVHSGAIATLPVAATGIRLHATERAPGFLELAARLRAGEPAAYAELSAAFLCIRGRRGPLLEFGVTVPVGDRTRRPDFRVALGGAPWTNVEVTAPNQSEATARAHRLIQALADRQMALRDGASIETLVLREPSPDELEALAQKAINLAATTQVVTEEIGDLAIVTVNRLPPCVIQPQDYGRELGPLIGTARGFVVNGVRTKSVSVRVPVIDQRAEGFLTTEARQIPTNEPGLIIMDIASVVGGFGDWEAHLRRRLQPTIHTRVSGVCLARWETRSTPAGEAVTPDVRLIENIHAAIPLPSWLREQLASASGVPVGK
jgi:hypothetical protein